MDENNISGIDSTVNVTDDREACPKNWIAAYTRPRSEMKATLELSKFEIETYVPIQKQLRAWGDRKRVVDVLVILRIIFANISEDEAQKIIDHSLVIPVISQPGRKDQARIPTDQIESLKHMLGQSDIPVSFEYGHFKSDQQACIVKGCLIGLTSQSSER